MKIVIDIPQIMYGAIKQYGITFLSCDEKKTLRKSIANGTPLPKNHGRLIDADAIPRHLVRDMDEIDKQPTIIEAEGSDSE